MALDFLKKMVLKKPTQHKSAKQNTTQKASTKLQRIVPGSVDSIQVDLTSFPMIRLDRKPKNTEFDAIRTTYLRQAFYSIRPYFDFLCAFDGVKENDDIKLVMRDVIFRYIETFWDMPASQEHHHSHMWGGLVHSLDTACREAKEFQSGKVFSAYGVDSERSQKDVMWQAFGGFLVGMLHDVGKIFDVEIQSVGQKKVTFEPMQGRLLDFYLVHPEGRKVRWKKSSSEYTKICWNMMFAWTYVPTEVYRAMPHDIMIDVMRKLLTYDSLKSDQASVKSWMTKSADEVSISRELGALIEETSDFFNADMSPKKSFYCCKVDENWYACNALLFPQLLAKKVGCKKEDIANMLRRNRLLGADPNSKNHYTKIAFVQKGKEFPKSVLFVRASLIDACMGEPAAVADVTFAESSRKAIAELFGECSPAISLQCFAPNEEEITEPAKSTKTVASKAKDKPTTPKKQPTVDVSSCIPKKPGPAEIISNASPEESGETVSIFPDVAAPEDATAAQVSTVQEAEPADLQFYKSAGKSITEEQALDLFEQFLSRIKEGKVQQAKNALAWLSLQGDLYFSYPAAINAALEIPANAGELSDDTKKLRSKFIAALATLGFVDDSHDFHAESTFTFYACGHEEGRPPVSLASGLFVKFNLDAVMNRNSRFDGIIQKHFSTINAVKAEQMSGGVR